MVDGLNQAADLADRVSDADQGSVKKGFPSSRSWRVYIPTCRRLTRAVPTRPGSPGIKITIRSIPPISIRRIAASGIWWNLAWPPCIVGCWGYFMPWMGVEKMKKHWRNLVARYGLSGSMVPGGRRNNAIILAQQGGRQPVPEEGWTRLGGLCSKNRSLSPSDHRSSQLQRARLCVEDPSVLDLTCFNRSRRPRSFPNTVKRVSEGYRTTPVYARC